MEPQIRYARTSDGISIAYWRIGAGPPLIQLPLMPYSNMEMEWQLPELRNWYERLARHATLIRYDGRGNGLSQRSVDDHSHVASLRDIQAVVEQIEEEPVTLLGVFHSGPTAIAYAAGFPKKVSHLILWCTYAYGPDYWRAAQAEGLRTLRQTDYELFLQTASHELFGWSVNEKAQAFAEVMREAVSPEEADSLIAETRVVDVRDDLSRIACPTLVIHRRQLRWLDASLSRDLAARISDARLAIIDGSSPLAEAGDVESAGALIDEFLGRDVPQAPGAFRTVLFTDLVGHTAMMSRLGDERGRAVLREHESITREVLKENGGTELKTMGDGFMASFGSVTKAVECAIALQRAFADRKGEPLSVRVGLNAGEPIEDDGDLFGATVILASRIAAKAEGGEILVSDNVRSLSAGKGFLFADRGEFAAKGFEEPVRIYEVSWR
jgi:class 3 adenylate cyclase